MSITNGLNNVGLPSLQEKAAFAYIKKDQLQQDPSEKRLIPLDLFLEIVRSIPDFVHKEQKNDKVIGDLICSFSIFNKLVKGVFTRSVYRNKLDWVFVKAVRDGFRCDLRLNGSDGRVYRFYLPGVTRALIDVSYSSLPDGTLTFKVNQ